MKIAEITSQNRRDFRAVMECESCGYMQENVSGYDDEHFHENVIPKMKCPECDEVAPESYRPMTTKYNKNQIV